MTTHQKDSQHYETTKEFQTFYLKDFRKQQKCHDKLLLLY